jgi:hypothetical protein
MAMLRKPVTNVKVDSRAFVMATLLGMGRSFELPPAVAGILADWFKKRIGAILRVGVGSASQVIVEDMARLGTAVITRVSLVVGAAQWALGSRCHRRNRP